MKIKKFSQLKENISILEKFLIIKASNRLGFLLIEIDEIEGDFVYFTALFKLYDDKIITMKDKNNLVKNRLEKRIIYQSKSLSDTLEQLKILKETNKYNI